MPLDLIKIYKLVKKMNAPPKEKVKKASEIKSEKRAAESARKNQEFVDYWKNKHGVEVDMQGKNEYHSVLVNDKNKDDMVRLKSGSLSDIKDHIKKFRSDYQYTNGKPNDKTIHVYKTEKGSDSATYVGTGKGTTRQNKGQYGYIEDFHKIKKINEETNEETNDERINRIKKILQIIKDRKTKVNINPQLKTEYDLQNDGKVEDIQTQ